MTLIDDVRNAGCRGLVRHATIALLVGALLTACGGGKDEAAGKSSGAGQGRNDKSSAAAQQSSANDKQARLASAVVDGKTTAPVDLKYDVLAKPEIGVPFEIELTFVTRLPADKLETEITEAPGLTIVGEATAAFALVEGGQSYVTKVLAKGDNPGLYYIGVTAKMSTNVQTEVRAFAIPIVIGDPPKAQKTSPPTDSAGQKVESIPAQERK